MLVYSLIKCSNSYIKTLGSLRQYCEDESDDNIADFNTFNFNSKFFNNTYNTGTVNVWQYHWNK